MKNILYAKVSKGCITPRWMALAYYDWMRDQTMMVAFPLHYLVMLAWWLNYLWCRYKHKPSWIDWQVVAAVDLREKEHHTKNRKWDNSESDPVKDIEQHV